MTKPTFVELGEMRVSGISIRTTNEQQSEGDDTIGELWKRYYTEGIQEQTPHQLDPNVVFGVYTDYESDETGAYRLLIGAPVTLENEMPKELESLVIPASTFAVFTSRRGPLVEVVVEMWQQVWEWSRQPGNKRTFRADFERYDRVNCMDPSNAQVQLFIACEPD